MATLVAKDCRELSKAASLERDPKKFMELIAQLNQALQQLDSQRNASTCAEKPED